MPNSLRKDALQQKRKRGRKAGRIDDIRVQIGKGIENARGKNTISQAVSSTRFTSQENGKGVVNDQGKNPSSQAALTSTSQENSKGAVNAQGKNPSTSRSWKRKVMNIWITIVVSLVGFFISDMIALLIQPDFFSKLIKQHPIQSLIVITVVVGLIIPTLIIRINQLLDPMEDEEENVTIKGSKLQKFQRSVFPSIVLPSASLSLVLLWIMVLFIRPAGCPDWICPAPQIITSPDGVHDDNLDFYFLTLQSASYVLSDSPTRYTLENLPTNEGASFIGEQIPYRVVVEVHNLRLEGAPIRIEKVDIVIVQVLPMTHLLNVWVKGEPYDYSDAPYRAVYSGEEKGAVLGATYVPSPFIPVQVASGESQQLDVQVTSHVMADIIFRVKVTYSTESEKHTLTLSKNFEVVFSNASNWHPYSLQHGKLVPGSVPIGLRFRAI